MKKLMLGAALLLTSCATAPTSTPFLSPDGRQAFGVNCGDFGMSACYTAAREACGGDYEVMESVDKTVPYSNPATGQIYGIADQRLYVICKAGAKQAS